MKTLIGLLLTSVCACAALTLEWDMNQEKHLGGYKLYIGEESAKPIAQMDVGKVNRYTFLSDFAPGKEYYFTVRAYTDKGEEGDPSNEVMYLSPTVGPTPTPAPTPALKISDIQGLEQALEAKEDKGHTHVVPAVRTEPSDLSKQMR